MTHPYAARAAHHAQDRDREGRRSTIISRWRLATFLPALAALIWAMSGEGPRGAYAAAILLFAVFGALVVWHARVEERVAWHDALGIVNHRALARIERRWDGLPPGDAPAGVDVTMHPYAFDLDLFGRASLFQWLGPAATPAGSERLASWLLGPADPDEITRRQQAVAELAALTEWREQLGAHGVLASGASHADVERLLSWAEGPPTFGGRQAVLRTAALAITGAIWLLLALQLTGIVDGAFWMIPLVAGLVLSFATTHAIVNTFERAGAGQSALSRYAVLLDHVCAPDYVSPRLAEVRQRLSAGGASAPACMRRLNHVLGFAALRSGAAILHFPIQALTLWDLHVAFALDNWRGVAGRRVRDWFAASGDVDALAALAGARYDNPSWSFPRVAPGPAYSARALGHPLIPDDRRVANDVHIGPRGTLLLVTGSNMSGKSTMLRAVGLGAVLAQAGGCVCASSLDMPPSDLETSIRVQDSLELGLSYFMAALARLKGVVDAAERPRGDRGLLYLLDEILQGTNSAERGIAVQAVARHLLAAGAIGVMTTHDLNLAQEEPLESAARLVHFTEIVDADGRMRFDYQLREGLATSRNALRLMKMIGIDL